VPYNYSEIYSLIVQMSALVCWIWDSLSSGYKSVWYSMLQGRAVLRKPNISESNAIKKPLRTGGKQSKPRPENQATWTRLPVCFESPCSGHSSVGSPIFVPVQGLIFHTRFAQLAFCFCWFLAWLTLRPWRWRLYVPPKRRNFSNKDGHTLNFSYFMM
jgi:hypothetical protein